MQAESFNGQSPDAGWLKLYRIKKGIGSGRIEACRYPGRAGREQNDSYQRKGDMKDQSNLIQSNPTLTV
jgi:hypothetical protein